MIGTSVRIVREKMGLDGITLAGLIGISPSYLSRIETNQRNPSPAVLSLIDGMAIDQGIPSNLVGMSDVSDPTARAVHAFMARPDVTQLRKDSVKAMIEATLKME